MVKNKRFLIALLVILALTIPRFIFIVVDEHDEVFFDENRMPDGPEDMKSWFARQVLVCDKCVEDLTEMQKKKISMKGAGKQLMYSVFHPDLDARTSLHPEESLRRFRDFNWGIPSREPDDEDKLEVPANILPLFHPTWRQDPGNKKWNGVFISPKSLQTISEKLKEMESSGVDPEELTEFMKKIARVEPIENLEDKLIYSFNDIKEYYCPFHENTKLTLTHKIPIYPQVRENLPEDTGYISRKYLSKDAPRILADLSIITSGKDRRSIHRPERCLPSQGYQPEKGGRKAIEIKFPGTGLKPLKIMMLKLQRTNKETNKIDKMLIFYWYASVEHTTHSNLKRMISTAWDRMILGRNYHWSYVLMSTYMPEADPEDEKRAVKGLYTLVQELWPIVADRENK